MKAFLNDPAIKGKYLSRVKAHASADELVKGLYWENGKGCAVGCTVHSSNHGAYETELGIPGWLARLEDVIFEGLPNKSAMKWPEKFLRAIPVGGDLNVVKSPFLIFVLESTLDKFDHKTFPAVKKAIDDVIELYTQNISSDDAAGDAARAAARVAVYEKFAKKLLELLKGM